MMGLLEEQSLHHTKQISLGTTHLLFGCQTEGDFLYRQQIEKYEAESLLELHLALS